ncbi:hypothetical protein EDC90_102446 [Martelella mediterranea]|uniref:Uncharacterized protein n=1 Tax=Martelella mediterranea TaxID=293089 RepID=A0A4R3NLY4_9HYPH|nr:hypothetical protein EDC90_102446 [Martelella mediterranea]
MPATDSTDEIFPDLLLPLWDVVNPGSQRLLGVTPGCGVPDVEEPLLVLVVFRLNAFETDLA